MIVDTRQPPQRFTYRLNQSSRQAQGLRAWWPMGWSQHGNRVYNLGYDRAGTGVLDTQNTWRVTPGLGPTLEFFGWSGGSAAASVNCGSNPSHRITNNFSAGGWVIPRAYDFATNIVMSISNDITTSGWEFGVRVDAGNTLAFAYNDGGVRGWFTGSTAIPTGNPVHVFFTRSGSSLLFYYNGVAAGAPGSVTTAAIVYSGDSTRLGDQTQNVEWNGGIGDLRIYDRVLTPREVYELYHANTRWELYESLYEAYGKAPGATLYTVDIDGSITSSGGLVKQTNKIFAGSSTPSATILKLPTKVFDGSITPVGVKIATPNKIFSGSIEPTGALVNQPQKALSGSITAAGALQRDTSKVLSGSVTPAGENLKTTTKIFAGSITATGENLNTAIKILAGSITATGDLLRQAQKILSGSITASATLQRDIFKVLSGSIEVTGSLLKTTTKILNGSITPSGALETFKIFLLVLDGSITASGELLKTTTKNFVGSITASGELLKQTQKVLSGSITPAGALTAIKTYFLELAGSIEATGALVKQTYKNFSGTITGTGALLRNPQKVLIGSITATGALLKSTAKNLSGTVQASGGLQTQAQKVLAGSITATGTLLKTPQKLFTGTITASGALLKSVTKVLSGSVTSSGALIKSTQKILAGSIAANAELTSAILGEFVMIPGQTARLRYRVQDYQNFWEVYLKRSDDNTAWDFYVDKMEAGVRSNEYTGNAVGTPTAIRAICDGNTHIVYTVEDGIYTPQHTFTDAFLASETDSYTVYSSVIIPVKHIAWPRNSSSYNVLNRE